MKKQSNEMKELERQFKTPKANPKFRVVPNLSLRGRDIMTRLKNRSLVIEANTVYSIDEQIDASRKMSKLDIMLQMRKNKDNILKLQQDINKLINSQKTNTNAANSQTN